MKLELMARRQAWSFGIDLIFGMRDGGNVVAVAKPLEFREIRPGDAVEEETVNLDNIMAQKLMDELWNCGIRPSEGTGSAGSLKATERHLEDMRTLVFKENKP